MTLSLFRAVVASVTHWGRREGGAEMWARVSWLSGFAGCWLSTRMLGRERVPPLRYLKEEEGCPGDGDPWLQKAEKPSG